MQIKTPEIQILNDSDSMVNSPARLAIFKEFSWKKKIFIRTQFGTKTKDATGSVFVCNRKQPGTFYVPTGIVPKMISSLEKEEVEFKLTGKLPEKFPKSEIGMKEIKGITLRKAQYEILKAVATEPRGVIQAATGTGKCFQKNTKILMYNGRLKNVQNIVPGDLVMGPDSKPRTVKSTASGYDEMFRIVPKDSGNPFVVNKGHTLSLIMSGNRDVAGIPCGKIFDIEMGDYLKQGKNFKHCAKGIRSSGVEFPNTEINMPVDPYYLGVWIGDGSTLRKNVIYTPEPEIKLFLRCYAKKLGLSLSIHKQRWCEEIVITNKQGDKHNNFLIKTMKRLGILEKKLIPKIYKYSSVNNRLEFLAGILDTDGHRMGRCNSYEISSKYEDIAKDIAFIAKSVGLSATVNSSWKKCQTMKEKREYFRVIIGGDTWKIPCKVARKKCEKYKKQKDYLRFGFDVQPIGMGKYYGFEIAEKDKHFLLGDFTITHNSICALGIYLLHKKRDKKTKCLFIAHTIDLVNQAADQFRKCGVKTGIIQGKTKENGDIICATIQTLKKLNPDWVSKTFSLMIWDECQHLQNINSTYFEFVQNSFIPYRYGMTATLPSTKEGRLSLEASIGPVIAKYDINDGIEDGVLSKPKVYLCPYKQTDLLKGMSYRYCYQEGIVENQTRNKKIASIAIKMAEKGESVLIFVKEIQHGNNISEILKANGAEHVWVHGSHSSDDRKAIKQVLEEKSCLIGICSTIWNEGVSINSLNNCVVAAGGKDSIAIVQIVGRGTRVTEDKNSVKIWDFLDKQAHLCGHLMERIDVYYQNGWSISVVKKKKG